MHSGDDQEPVARLYEWLAEALQRTRPAGFDAPVTVAEIYQELVPYRAVRGEFGFSMNADYEHVLLRLLSGEAGLVRLDPTTARDEIVRELQSPNPNVSIYRAYAGCDAWIRPLPGARVAGGSAPAGGAAPTGGAASAGAAASTGGVGARAVSRAPVASAVPEREPAPSAGAARVADPAADPPAGTGAASPAGLRTTCAFCDGALPTHRVPRYCPYCGVGQARRPCGSCGETLEPGWTFCIACGVADPRVPRA
jgi:hypothetical protein